MILRTAQAFTDSIDSDWNQNYGMLILQDYEKNVECKITYMS